MEIIAQKSYKVLQREKSWKFTILFFYSLEMFSQNTHNQFTELIQIYHHLFFVTTNFSSQQIIIKA